MSAISLQVTQAMNMNSHHTQQALEALHENIAVMSVPSYLSSEAKSVYFYCIWDRFPFYSTIVLIVNVMV